MSYGFESCRNNCLLPWDVNTSLKHLFQFLKNHQENPDGTIVDTNLYLGIASQKNLNSNNFRTRDLAYNLIYGKILQVNDDYIIIESRGSCPSSTEPYLVLYSQIQTLYSLNIKKYYSSLLQGLNTLPDLCKYYDNEIYSLSYYLSRTLYDIKDDPAISIVIIYGGIFSQVFPGDELNVVRNLILFTAGYVTPMNWVDGYFKVTPTPLSPPVGTV